MKKGEKIKEMRRSRVRTDGKGMTSEVNGRP